MSREGRVCTVSRGRNGYGLCRNIVVDWVVTRPGNSWRPQDDGNLEGPRMIALFFWNGQRMGGSSLVRDADLGSAAG